MSADAIIVTSNDVTLDLSPLSPAGQATIGDLTFGSLSPSVIVPIGNRDINTLFREGNISSSIQSTVPVFVGTVEVGTVDSSGVITYTETRQVEFLDWDGTVLSSSRVDYGFAAVAPSNPTRVGHTFSGWDADFSSIVSDMTVTALYEPIRPPASPQTGDASPLGVLCVVAVLAAATVLILLRKMITRDR